jgi:predicted RNA binding protein YcfA (HicA-like mRNA interferase family)
LARSRNVRFSEAFALARGFGFDLVRISGSHHILAHPSIPELLNLQNVRGQAKPYQLRQMLELVEHYDLSLGDEP